MRGGHRAPAATPPQVLRLLEVYIDGGIRRGTDVVKALVLGARAIAIGRPALFGLAGYGADGVETLLQIIEEETATAARLLDVNTGRLVREMDVDEEGDGLWGMRAKL
jgi:isopentenyl diphosphate isomerase/L-lactate dehydrogenase-like FMN-dependent dehydrogenase